MQRGETELGHHYEVGLLMCHLRLRGRPEEVLEPCGRESEVGGHDATQDGALVSQLCSLEVDVAARGVDVGATLLKQRRELELVLFECDGKWRLGWTTVCRVFNAING